MPSLVRRIGFNGVAIEFLLLAISFKLLFPSLVRSHLEAWHRNGGPIYPSYGSFTDEQSKKS